MNPSPHRPGLRRLSMALFALAALTMLLIAARLRFLVPIRRRAPGVRDLTWPRPNR